MSRGIFTTVDVDRDGKNLLHVSAPLHNIVLGVLTAFPDSCETPANWYSYVPKAQILKQGNGNPAVTLSVFFVLNRKTGGIQHLDSPRAADTLRSLADNGADICAEVDLHQSLGALAAAGLAAQDGGKAEVIGREIFPAFS